MGRRHWLVSLAALVAALGALVFPGESSALQGRITISLDSSGPSPAAVSTPADFAAIWFHNTDSAAHSIAFANGWCSAQVAPGDQFDCGAPPYVGDYSYTVDGSTQGDVTVTPRSRSVSLTARGHSIRHGSVLSLRGRLEEEMPLPGPGGPQPILILSRPDRQHPYHRVAVVMAKLDRTPRRNAPFGELIWHLRTRPKVGTVYTAEAIYQPSGGRVWEQAFSKPFRVQLKR